MQSSKHSIAPADAAKMKGANTSANADRIGDPGLGWTTALTWLLGFIAVVYLGLKGGGYDPLVHDQVGIAIWWILAGTVLVGALPRHRPGTLAWCALALIFGFLAWTALSLVWTESSERTLADAARISGYAGFFVLAVLGRETGGARQMVAAIGSGIVIIAIVALLSRLHPAWFPDAIAQTEAFLPGAQERLAYPIDYWNGLAGLIAIGLPLLLQMATDARHVAVRALAAAAIPVLMLTIYFTLSRGGIGSAAIAIVVFFAFSHDRIPKLLNAAVPALGGALLIAIGSSRDPLVNGFTGATAKDQGNELILLTIIVCLVVALLRVATAAAQERVRRPRWSLVSSRDSALTLGAAIAVLIVIGIAAGGPGMASDAWHEFTHSSKPIGGSERLGSVAGENRYAIWSSAVREMKSDPLTGTGSGTFEYWWNRDGTVTETIVDTHSLYLQTLGELGVIGLLLITAFLLTVLIGGSVSAARAGPERRTVLAAALAGCVAFAVSSGFDWLWQIPVLAICVLLLAAVLVSDEEPPGEERAGVAPPLWARGVVALAALGVIVVIAIPLAGTSLVRSSQDEARDGDTLAALADAEAAASIEPFAASPYLQEALLLEGQGDLDGAAVAAAKGAAAESTNWRTWLVVSRIEAKRGHAAASLAAYRRAKSLNPRSPLFSP